MNKNKVIVRINGSEYTLTGSDSEDYLFSIANYVNKKLKEVIHFNPKHSNTSAAILTALTTVDELFKARRENEVLKQRLGEPEEKYNKLKDKFVELNGEYENLQQEYSQFNEFYENTKNDTDKLKEELEAVIAKLQNKNEEYEMLIRENAYLKEQNSNLENKIEETSNEASSLKNELLENQIELVRVRKDYKELRDIQIKKRGIT